MGTVYANSTFVICCKVSSQLCTLEEDPVMLVGSIQQAECEKKFSLCFICSGTWLKFRDFQLYLPLNWKVDSLVPFWDNFFLKKKHQYPLVRVSSLLLITIIKFSPVSLTAFKSDHQLQANLHNVNVISHFLQFHCAFLKAEMQD